MVANMRSIMSLFVSGLSYLTSKEDKNAILIEDMEIAGLMVDFQQVREDKFRDREEFCRKKSKMTIGHLIRECLKNRKPSGNGGNKAQSSSAALTDRAAPRGATSGTCGGENRLYAITSRQQKENSPDVVTCMIKVFTFDVYALLDPGASLSFLTLYIAMRFDTLPEDVSRAL
ncbi:uncharacterized protein LOC125856005 [Solanum stenotomum]|uniref:uncharacterized protein LOC125856005 n=1 Tax=Solanum stenotomum TaxID=172797 RepID=UPI0020D03887|nr:uncharacterized protein LOC125856005 [Solanum stenotomum]